MLGYILDPSLSGCDALTGQPRPDVQIADLRICKQKLRELAYRRIGIPQPVEPL